MERTLLAWIDRQQIGTLTDHNGIWSFRYAPAWLEAPRNFALCPGLPLQVEEQQDGSTRRPVQWYFDNLLPEEGQRVLLASAAKVDGADAFGLLGHYGAESAGSLTLFPPGSEQGEGGLRSLSDADLSARIVAMPSVPLVEGALKRMSLAGAQHKLAVVLQDGQLFEPSGRTPSTHILKPDHPHLSYAHSVINEWFVMTLARRLGLAVPRVERRYVPQPVYLIERFDRQQDAEGWRRLHSIDACQVLGLSAAYKYLEGSVGRLVELAAACRSAAVARTALFQWLVFNVLVGNTDAHLKNLSFLASHAGIQLAPFYDLICTAVYDTPAFDQARWPAATTLAWPIEGRARIAEVDRRCLMEVGEAMRIRPSTVARLLDSLRDKVAGEAQALYAQVERENAELIAQRPELAATFAGELRCLRTILHVVIAEQVARLR
ncbi:HipA domain-containing protein [Azotobacter beijerinckii]|uniref:Serine/threonine-protein kinase HipA n=1 Tax=Azotobacter beijerinckii TaxID=170623 RepID=A0A1I4BV18_9GAMM|nr:HipA domain-containing protein [Azotobacter beijerinckii]SFB54685.1 serine/threonine-protein kinase HipA [Azotobacter beijerinckii]SFK72654.1 serine/threonine-protein kinase HipA [Azotobacter beijerinckii]